MKLACAGASPLTWLAVGLAAFVLLPWYSVSGSLLELALPGALMAEPESATGLWQVLLFGQARLLVAPLALIAAALAPRTLLRWRGAWMLAWGLGGAVCLVWQAAQQPAVPRLGLGLGAAMVLACLLGLGALGLSRTATRLRGEVFASVVTVFAAAVLLLFVAYPLLRGLASAFAGEAGGAGLAPLVARLATPRIWSVACLTQDAHCGVALNTLFLALLTGAGTTVLGALLALAELRSGWRFARAIRALVPLPFIAPPFVAALVLVLLFGRAGLVTRALEEVLGLPASRALYGLPGLWLAQMLAFSPVAYLIVRTALVGLNPALEESARTMGASAGFTFRRVTLPLLARPLAQAFLVGFLESIADFGTPIVVGGSYAVLSTEVFFAIVGAQFDAGRAAALGLLLGAFALAVFGLQRRVVREWPADGGNIARSAAPPPLPRALRIACIAIGGAWVVLTLVLYAGATLSAFVEVWGRDFHPTLRHFELVFGLAHDAGGWQFTGLGWDSLATSLRLAAVAAVLTAVGALAIAWVLETTALRGRAFAELGAMASLAVPGTVLGLCYGLVFNRPPLELTGTSTLIVLCLVFRNLPACVGMATTALRQVGTTLNDVSRASGARGFATLAGVYLPLLRPAVASVLVYGFVRSMTTLSPVIFLVTAETELATTFIISRVGQGDYGVAFAYTTVFVALLAVFMAAANAWAAGQRLARDVRPSRYLRAPA